MKIKFEFERETKGTYRFKEAADEPVIGTLYIKKSALKDLGVDNQSALVVSISKGEK